MMSEQWGRQRRMPHNAEEVLYIVTRPRWSCKIMSRGSLGNSLVRFVVICKHPEVRARSCTFDLRI